MEALWVGGMKVPSNGHGHKTEMAAMPIYDKNFKKSSSLEPKSRCPWNLVCNIRSSSTSKSLQMMTLGWPWPILLQGQIWSLMLLYGKKVKQWIFQKLLSSMIWNKQQMTEVTRSFHGHQNFVPCGAERHLPRSDINVLNHEKNCIKSDFKDIFLEFATNERSDKKFLLTSKLVPWGLSAPALYTCIKSWKKKKMYKIRLQRDFFFNLQQMTEVKRCSCWHQNFIPKGLSAPAPGLYTCIKSWKKLYKIRIRREFFWNL